jgi:tetratricopeptide (TPR) repeat protein
LNAIKRSWNWGCSRFLRNLADAHRHFANEYGNRQEYQLAVNNYSRAIARDPEYAQPYYNRGVLYYRELGEHEGAIRDLTRAIELKPGWGRAYFNRGLAYKMRGEVDKAIADLERYLELGQHEFWLEAAHRQLAELAGQEEEMQGA